MNSTKAVYKLSKMMKYTNAIILLVFILQMLLSMLGGVLGTSWLQLNLDASYLEFNKVDTRGYTMTEKSASFMFVKLTGTWILICTNFVPISLLVTLEMVKFLQGIFMEMDVSMYDEDQLFPMRAQSTNINEELGQVEYIFSDKTGTLTCNIMEFKKFSTGFGPTDAISYEIFKRKEF